MKNITLAVEDNVLAAVRELAAERNTTVNALVRDYLGTLAEQVRKEASDRARKELVRLSEELNSLHGRLEVESGRSL